MNLWTSPQITWNSRNNFINIYSIITKNKKIKKTYPWPHLGIIKVFITEKVFLRLRYMLNRTLKTNLEPRWPLKSNLELRWPPFVSRDLSCLRDSQRPDVRTLGRFGTIRAEDQSNEKKKSVRENTTFGTAQSYTPIDRLTFREMSLKWKVFIMSRVHYMVGNLCLLQKYVDDFDGIHSDLDDNFLLFCSCLSLYS